MLCIWFWQAHIISAEREIPLARENKTHNITVMALGGVLRVMLARDLC